MDLINTKIGNFAGLLQSIHILRPKSSPDDKKIQCAHETRCY